MHARALFSMAFLALASARWAGADTIELKAGDKLNGRIDGITTTNITIKTAYAGTLRIDRALIVRIVTETPVQMALANGDRLVGRLDAVADGPVSVATAYGNLQITNAALVTAAWQPGSPDPTLPPGTVWTYSAFFDLMGRSGNTRGISLGGGVDATMSGPNDDLKLFGKGGYAKSEGVLSEKDIEGGMDFEHRFTSMDAWYVRDDARKDDVMGIDFRNVLAGGYGRYIFREADRDLRLRAGVGYTDTSYNDPGRKDDSGMSLDSGLSFHDTITPYLKWSTDLTFQPMMDKFSNYYATHESKVILPLAKQGWSLEMGIDNLYASKPDADRKKLDTVYFTRTRLAW